MPNAIRFRYLGIYWDLEMIFLREHLFFVPRLAQHDQREDLLSELRPPLDLQMLRLDYVAPTPTERQSLFTAAKNGDTAMLDEILSLGFSGDLSCSR